MPHLGTSLAAIVERPLGMATGADSDLSGMVAAGVEDETVLPCIRERLEAVMQGIRYDRELN